MERIAACAQRAPQRHEAGRTLCCQPPLGQLLVAFRAAVPKRFPSRLVPVGTLPPPRGISAIRAVIRSDRYSRLFKLDPARGVGRAGVTLAAACDAEKLAAALVFVVSVLVFWRTAYPTITWWDSSSYSLAAATLGIASPPGSLLLTLAGWPVAHLPLVASPAHALNLLAGVFAAIAAALIVLASTYLLRLAAVSAGRHASTAAVAGAAVGALAFAFTGTLWSYAGRFTPYVLSTVFTVCILWTLLRWWDGANDQSAWRWLALLGLLFGLDFSVHRTNALLMPGAVLWIAIRRPRTMLDARAVLGGLGGLAAGLAFHFVLIPLAAVTRSPLDFSHPSTLATFWDYVTIKQLGGSFLLQLFPRKAPFWGVQTRDFLQVLGADFLHWDGAWSVFGILPAVAIVVGFIVLWRANARLAGAFVTLVATQAALTVLYFNIPANYFRTFDRHYLPVCVSLAVVLAFGAAASAQRAAQSLSQGRPILAAAITGLVILLPVSQLRENWPAQNASHRFFARDYAANALRQLPPNAIYFTVGDNDTFPVMYMQSVEGMRPDVTIINLSVANIPEWPDRLHRRDPALPMSLSLAQRNAATATAWADTAIALPIIGGPAQLGVESGMELPDSIKLDVKPRYGTHMLPAEVLLLDIVRTNRWRRPLTFATTGTEGAMEWLAPFGRLEGLYYRVVPLPRMASDPAVLRAHLLEQAEYRGYADPAVTLDDVSRRIGALYYVALQALLQVDTERHDANGCRADRSALLSKLPLERLDPPAELRSSIATACGSVPDRPLSR